MLEALTFVILDAMSWTDVFHEITNRDVNLSFTTCFTSTTSRINFNLCSPLGYLWSQSLVTRSIKNGSDHELGLGHLSKTRRISSFEEELG